MNEFTKQLYNFSIHIFTHTGDKCLYIGLTFPMRTNITTRSSGVFKEAIHFADHILNKKQKNIEWKIELINTRSLISLPLSIYLFTYI